MAWSFVVAMLLSALVFPVLAAWADLAWMDSWITAMTAAGVPTTDDAILGLYVLMALLVSLGLNIATVISAFATGVPRASRRDVRVIVTAALTLSGCVLTASFVLLKSQLSTRAPVIDPQFGLLVLAFALVFVPLALLWLAAVGRRSLRRASERPAHDAAG